MIALVADDPQQVPDAAAIITPILSQILQQGLVQLRVPQPDVPRLPHPLHGRQERRPFLPVLQLHPVARVPQKGEPLLGAPEEGVQQGLLRCRPVGNRRGMIGWKSVKYQRNRLSSIQLPARSRDQFSGRQEEDPVGPARLQACRKMECQIGKC